jgi:TP901 family phage tail tape measure protein
MAKKLNVDIGFTADTTQAKKQIAELQTQLTQLINAQAGNKGLNLGIDQELQKASVAAATLQQQLKDCVNVDTGKLDLGKFTQQMKASGMSMTQYKDALLSLGPQGAQVFSSLAQSVMTAEIPLKRSSALLHEMGTTLKNTIRWQLSSSMLHGFMGAIQSAYGYAQDLDSSLNNIRIVTGHNIDQMEKFAVKANKAAQALSTTTTAYTDAALIYYQQGLNDEQVEERTNATVKMANVVGEDAQHVSSYMTAIWNNFADGSKELEYYGDVMAELGAKTAASSAEIAAGLEKFAAIGETVGLSYEYAAASVATVVDKTRQSADTVGTAFKTIFSRLQGLQLGETLDDGTNLNKYSSALQAVGIDIKTANGELKDMDVILDEMGEKWDTLHRDEKMALAQTVAGVRQYTQLISLMDNYDAFKENVSAAQNSEGTLDQQSEIYAQSWEAARDRVRASLEGIYDKLLDDQFFIGFLNVLDKIIDGVSGLVDGLGGLGGVLTMVGAILIKVFQKDLTESVDRAMYNIMMKTEKGRQQIKETREEANAALKDMYSSSATPSGDMVGQAYASQATAQDELIRRAEKMTEAQRGIAQILMDQHQTLVNSVVEQAKLSEAAEAEANAIERAQKARVETSVKAAVESGTVETDDVEAETKAQKEKLNQYQELTKQASTLGAVVKKTFASGPIIKKEGKEITALKKQVESLFNVYKNDDDAIETAFGGAGLKALKEFRKTLDKTDLTAEEAEDAITKLLGTVEQMKGVAGDLRGDLADGIIDENDVKTMEASGEALGGTISKMVDAETSASTMGDKLDKIPKMTQSVSQGFVALAGTLSTVAMGLQSIKGLIDVWNNEDMSFGEKLLTTFTTLATVIPMVTTAFSKDTREKVLNTAAEIANWMAKKMGVASNVEEAATETAATTAEGAHTSATIAQTVAQWAQNAAMGPFLLIILAVVAAIALLVVGVLAIVAAFKAWQASTPEAKLKAAEEESARLTEELKKAKEASEELKESIEGYDSAVDKIKTLQEGTEEWRKAIEDANDAARKLIDENREELAGKYSFNAETGLIEFEKGALEELEKNAHKKVEMVQAQKLMSDNAVITAQQTVDNSKAVKNENFSVGKAFAGAGAAAVLAPALAPILGTMAIHGSIAQAANDKAQAEALANLQEAYYQTGGNLTEAMNMLGPTNTALIESLGYTSDELQELCAASRANTQAILENNKQIINSNFSDSTAYQQSSNKEFLNEVLAQDLSDETDRLYEQKYKDMAGGMTDADVQKQYAEMMGWDANLVDNQSGNKAVYIDNEGNEVTISDEQVRKYLAQQEALKNVEDSIESVSGDISKLALQEKALANAADGSIESYEEYREAMHAYGKELGLTQAEIDSYIAKQGSMTDVAKKATLANNIQGWGHGKEDSRKAAEALAGGLTEHAGLSVEDQMDIMVRVSATADSFDEFKRNFEQALNESFLQSFQDSSANLENIMATAEETGQFAEGDIKALEEDANFQAYLEETGQTMLEFTSANYSKKYAIISEFYADLKAAEYEALEASKANYEADLAEYQAIIDYKRSLNEDGTETEQSKAIREQFDNIDFSAYMEMDISDVEAKMDEVQNAIDEIDGQKIKLDLEWESTDAVENSMKKIGSFAKTMEKDAKKVGNSYQLTAAQAKEWMQVYPELFQNAEVTTDGLISLNGDYVNDFIDGQEASTDAAIDANIEQLESRISELEAEKAAYEADLELAKSNAFGKEQLANASKEYLAETRDKLTQYYIDCGLDEVAAQKAALDTMGLNEAEYSELVANSYSRNAENQIESAEQGASGQASALSKLWGKVKEWASAVGNLFKNVWGALTGKVEWSEVWGAFSGGDITSDTQVTGITAYDEKGNFQEGSEAQRTAALEEINKASVADMEAAIASIDGRIASIRSEIAYNQALKNQNLEDFGSTDPDDVDGTNDSSGSDNKKEIEDLIEIAERYHEITREIEMQERKLDSLSKKKDRAFGGDKLKYMKQEQQELEKLYEKQEELLLAQSLFLESDKLKLKDAFKTGIDFDADGNISNYSALLQEATDKFNKAKEAYNNSAQEDGDKEALEKAEKEYDKQIELLEQYEETLDAWWDQKAELEDVANQILDAKLEALDYEVQMHIEVADDDLAYLEYLLERIENRAFSAADAIANLGKQTQEYVDKNNAYEAGMKEIFGNHGLTDEDYNKWMQGDQATIDKIGAMSFTEAEVEKLREYRDGLMETNQALIETRQAVHDKMIATFEEQNAKLDEGIAKLEHYKAVTESYKNIVDLVGKANFKDSDKTIKALNSSMVTQSANIAKANIAKRNKDKDELEATRKAFEQQKDKISEDERKMWEDTIKQMEESLRASEEAAMGSIETWMQAINDKFIAEVEATMDRFSETVAGKFKNLNELQEAFERRQSENDRYLDDYKKIYEFSKLNRDIEKSIDQTDNVRAKKELLKLQEEINELEESGAEVSEYQMENLRKRYELKLAELALEEAQNAKSQVRMSVDNEGNWGYVYTADASQVAAAEQSYEDKLFELQEQNAEYINTLQENIIQMQIEMKDKLAEIANDESLSIEERQAKMAEVQEYYKGQMDYYASEMNLVCDNNKQLYTEDWTAYAERTDYKISEDEKYVDSFEETDLAVLTGFENMVQYQQNFNDASSQMLTDSNAAFNTWEEEMDMALDAAGLDFQDLSEDMQDKLAEIDEKSNETAETIKSDAEQMVEDYQTVVDAVIEWETQYSTSVDNMLTATEELITKFNEVLALWAQVQKAAETPLPDPPQQDGGGGDGTDGDGNAAADAGVGGGSGGGGDDGMPPDNSSKAEGVAAAIWMDGGAKSGWYNGSDRRSRLSEKGVTAAQSYINAHGPNGDIYRSWASRRGQLKSYYYGSFDTGGYTGEWGADGKFAMLHEKELVLNKTDTSNILSAVDMIREISNVIDLNAMSASQGLTSLLGAGRIGEHKESLEQNVTIHAEFPGVSDRNEIQEAFNNLINAASQYANRKL